MKSLNLFTLPFCFLLACGLDDGKTSQSPSEALATTATIARSVMAPVPSPPSGPFACVVGRQFSLVSTGAELRINSHQFPLLGCEAVRLLPDYKNYLVDQVIYRDGAKTYKGTSKDGAVELVDHRQQAGFKSPWTVTMVDTSSDLPKTSLFQGQVVEDENLKASGDHSVDLLLELHAALDNQEVNKLVYSLRLDPNWSGPVGDSRTYQLRVISDFAVEHVLNQLDLLTVVKNVAAVHVDEDPWPPTRSGGL